MPFQLTHGPWHICTTVLLEATLRKPNVLYHEWKRQQCGRQTQTFSCSIRPVSGSRLVGSWKSCSPFADLYSLPPPFGRETYVEARCARSRCPPRAASVAARRAFARTARTQERADVNRAHLPHTRGSHARAGLRAAGRQANEPTPASNKARAGTVETWRHWHCAPIDGPRPSRAPEQREALESIAIALRPRCSQ